MDRPVTRREFVAGLGSLGALALGTNRGTLAAQAEAPGFRPAEHGYGFRNWGPRTQYFETPQPSPADAVRDTIRKQWQAQAEAVLGLDTMQFPEAVVDLISAQLRTGLSQQAGTNGHCYGMVLTAQEYYERPETMPIDRRVASEITHPTAPVDSPDAPVYTRIVERQASQYLRFRAWLGRRALFKPDWIDLEQVVSDIESRVAGAGTASLILYNESNFTHQVLAYGFEDDGDTITIPVYDPNRPAEAYKQDPLALRLTRENGSLSMTPYKGYTGVLFNRYDQIEQWRDREAASPLNHWTVGLERVLEALFPAALVLTDTDAVNLTTCGADDSEVARQRGTFMDRTRGPYARVRSLYGRAPESCTVTVSGAEPADYELTTLVADRDGSVVESARTASIDAGENHRYNIEGQRGRLQRAERSWDGAALASGASVTSGTAAGALGYRELRRRRTEE